MLDRDFLDCLFFQVFQQRTWDPFCFVFMLLESLRGEFAVFAVDFFLFKEKQRLL